MLTSIIYLHNENMNLEMTIKKLGSAYKFRVCQATGNEHIFCLALFSCHVRIMVNKPELIFSLFIKTFELFSVVLTEDIFTYHTTFTYKYYIKDKEEIASFTQAFHNTIASYSPSHIVKITDFFVLSP